MVVAAEDDVYVKLGKHGREYLAVLAYLGLEVFIFGARVIACGEKGVMENLLLAAIILLVST